ncbi:hypothetical protein EDB19DRAFT_1741669 [Suillus lakei]|nr:hypothetical protein EDB19DRAFT_1741669 [Suillus lakei]
MMRVPIWLFLLLPTPGARRCLSLVFEHSGCVATTTTNHLSFLGSVTASQRKVLSLEDQQVDKNFDIFYQDRSRATSERHGSPQSSDHAFSNNLAPGHSAVEVEHGSFNPYFAFDRPCGRIERFLGLARLREARTSSSPLPAQLTIRIDPEPSRKRVAILCLPTSLDCCKTA